MEASPDFTSLIRPTRFRSISLHSCSYTPIKMRTFTTLAAVFAAVSPAFAAEATTTTSSAASSTASGVQEPSSNPTLGAQVVQGCFSSWGNLIFNSTPEFNSKSACAFDICYAGKFTVAASSAGNECYCGTEYPPEDTLADDSKCDTPCPGYGLQACRCFCFPWLMKINSVPF